MGQFCKQPTFCGLLGGALPDTDEYGDGLFKIKPIFEIIDDGYKLSNGDFLSLEDLVVRYTSKSDCLVANDTEIVIKLDTTLTEELKEEGLAREIVRNIQDGRKSLNLEISDRIKVAIKSNLTDKMLQYISNETLADLCELESYDLLLEVNSNDNIAVIKIKK